jgi:hypothetical protein
MVVSHFRVGTGNGWSEPDYDLQQSCRIFEEMENVWVCCEALTTGLITDYEFVVQ